MIRIKELRIQKNLNMRQTAKALGIPYTTYISYEKGDREPNSEMLINLADFFNCSIDYLLGRSDEPIDDSVLDKVLELDQDILEEKGNIYDAKKAQLERDKGKTINELFTETVCKKEIIHITKYRTLDEYGKQAVDSILNIEYDRCTKPVDAHSINIGDQPEKTYTGIAAAYGGDNKVNQVSEKHLREAADMIWEDEENED